MTLTWFIAIVAVVAATAGRQSLFVLALIASASWHGEWLPLVVGVVAVVVIAILRAELAIRSAKRRARINVLELEMQLEARRREERRRREELRQQWHQRPVAPTRPQWMTELDLQPGASLEDARRAFRALAKRYHPDANGGRGDHAALGRVTAAWADAKEALGAERKVS